MESSDSDTTDEWIVLDDDDDGEIKVPHENLSESTEDHETCDTSDVQTTSLQFVEDGNPPGNNDAPPIEDLFAAHVNDNQGVQDIVDQVEDLSDLSSSYIKDELPGDIDVTPTIRHYVHNKNAYLNSLLNIYLILAVTAAIALGFGNFLGWSNCDNLKENVQKQGHMLGELQQKLNDCILLLNQSNLLDSGLSRNSRQPKEIEFQEKDLVRKHGSFLEQKNLRNFVHYPFPSTKSRSELSHLFRKFDKNDQVNVLKHILYSQIMKPNLELINFRDSGKHVTEFQEGNGNIGEFITHKLTELHAPGFEAYSVERPAVNLDSKSRKEMLLDSDIMEGKWAESLFNLKSKLNVHNLFVDEHSGDFTTSPGMQNLDMPFSQKEGSQPQEMPHSSYISVVDGFQKWKTSDSALHFDVRNHQLNHDFVDLTKKYSEKSSTSKNGNNNHIAHIIYSIYNMVFHQQMKSMKDGSFGTDLNVTQFVFQALLENLGEKLEDIKNFTLSPLFLKHSHHGQKAVKKLMKAFINFVDKLLKHSDMFVQRNIHDDDKMSKLMERILTNINKLDCRWQEIKNKWHQIIQHEEDARHVKFGEKKYFGPVNQKKFSPEECRKARSIGQKVTKGCKKKKFVGGKMKKKNVSKRNGKEKGYKMKPIIGENSETENTKHSNNKFMKKDLKEKRYNLRSPASGGKNKIHLSNVEEENRKGVKKNYKGKIPNKRKRSNNGKGRESNHHAKQHQKH